MGDPVTDELLTRLRKDAVEAWLEVIGLQPHLSREQLEVTLKFAITAQANYTMACWRKVLQDEGHATGT